MSDPSDQDPAKPSVSTSTVPLRKETVRISLRAPSEESGPVAPKGSTTPVPSAAPPTPPPAGGAPTPPPPPSAPTPPPAPSAPTPSSPPAATSAGPKTIPLSKAPDPMGPTTPVSVGPDPLGPTAPVATAPPAAAPGPPVAASPIGAKTIPLSKMPPSGGPAPVGKVTTPLGPQSGAKPLPQATVKLTQPMAGAATSGLAQQPVALDGAAEEEWEEDYEESGLMPFAILVLLLALVVLAIEVLTKMGIGS